MKRLILPLASLTLVACLASNAIAGPPHRPMKPAGVHKPKGAFVVTKGHHIAGPRTFTNYHVSHGVKCSYGYCYKGFNHGHWSSVCYSPVYGCKVYYCPCTCCNYYWCAWDNCFYPVTYCPYGCYVF